MDATAISALLSMSAPLHQRKQNMAPTSILKSSVLAQTGHSAPAGATAYQMRLEAALNVAPFVRKLSEANPKENTQADSSEDDSDVLFALEEEARDSSVMLKSHVSAFDRMKRCRRYLRKRKEEESSSDPEESEDEEWIKDILRTHLRRKKLRRKVRNAPENETEEDYAEESEGQLVVDGENENRNKEDASFLKKDLSENPNALTNIEDEENYLLHMDVEGSTSDSKRGQSTSTAPVPSGPPTVEQLTARRRKLWAAILKREIAKGAKARNYNARERTANCRRVAQACMRAVRQKAVASQRSARDTLWRTKRLTREMQTYWKKVDRVTSQQRKQQEKELEEQQKQDYQLLEAKRAQRKLNFLITQTELYAHFIAKKIDRSSDTEAAEGEAKILERLDEGAPASERLAAIDDFDANAVKTMARNNASQALEAQQQRTSAYDADEVVVDPVTPVVKKEDSVQDRQQPEMFQGTLKNYQLKGMNWLVNLYDQGINGILADEMGLGKTVQALALLGHVAEKYNMWGPFLVVTPASTLHNWQQEVSRFVPEFKVVPYWGSPQERKILRHFWDQRNLHTRGASFHIVITSYQLVITDFKYFNRIKWQYLILDEAQAIKSSGSLRWKMLLEFKCRNRLLLSGTPIQNSMAELWSLLHFVMPTLFDSHEEFNDWFSKDIENSAENKGQMDEMQISRLHMILKPFMLRRIKKDVENELTDKLEVLMYCPLTIRQKLLYMGLKRKIKIEDLLQGLGSQKEAGGGAGTLTSSLMNLVMQFRKVCNHPELFERREARSPFAMNLQPYFMPKLITRSNIHDGNTLNTKNHILYDKLFVFNPVNVRRSLDKTRETVNERLEISDSAFSYLRFVDISEGEQSEIVQSVLAKWLLVAKELHRRKQQRKYQTQSWKRTALRSKLLIVSDPVPEEFIFASHTDPLLGHADVNLCSMQETISHRLMRTKCWSQNEKERRRKERAINRGCDAELSEDEEEEDLMQKLVEEIDYIQRPKQTLRCYPLLAPQFLYAYNFPRVATTGRLPYSHDRSAAYRVIDHQRCAPPGGRDAIMHGSLELKTQHSELRLSHFHPVSEGGVWATRPSTGWSNIAIPDKQTLVSDSGKLHVLDGLLTRLKEQGHRVLIYSQMTRMIDLLEEFMWHRKHTFMRLDGSSKISERRDMVADFQTRSDIFVFLLSTRAGGLGINLTAADTVIFYDSDWNPTVDQQAMDRAHRLGQTKQVTVYRLICKGTIEERILQRAKEKSEIQRMVITGGSFKGKQGELKPKEVVSLLLDDEEIERKYKAKEEEKLLEQDMKVKKRERAIVDKKNGSDEKRFKPDPDIDIMDDSSRMSTDSMTIDVESVGGSSRERTRPPSPIFDFMGEKLGPKRLRRGTGGKRGRPRGLKKGGGTGREDLVPGLPNGGVVLGGSLLAKRGPGRPRSSKPGGGPLHQGGRGPPPRPPKQSMLKDHQQATLNPAKFYTESGGSSSN